MQIKDVNFKKCISKFSGSTHLSRHTRKSTLDNGQWVYLFIQARFSEDDQTIRRNLVEEWAAY